MLNRTKYIWSVNYSRTFQRSNLRFLRKLCWWMRRNYGRRCAEHKAEGIKPDEVWSLFQMVLYWRNGRWNKQPEKNILVGFKLAWVNGNNGLLLDFWGSRSLFELDKRTKIFDSGAVVQTTLLFIALQTHETVTARRQPKTHYTLMEANSFLRSGSTSLKFGGQFRPQLGNVPTKSNLKPRIQLIRKRQDTGL